VLGLVHVIGSATESQAAAERMSAQPLPDPADEMLNALRARALSRQPLLLAAITELPERPHSAAFEVGLDHAPDN
jgi:TetR/AcrR family tetracycline transcriptional repressor